MNLWILTEERPKKEVLLFIIEKFVKTNNISCFIDNLRVIPVLDKINGNFTFTYKVIGFNSEIVHQIIIKIVSGESSFLDFLVFYQDSLPQQDDIPLFVIEETKTDDSESRNTGVFQRCSKFVYVEFFYKNIDKTIFYNLKIKQKKEPTDTYIFGVRCLKTLNVNFHGKKEDIALYKPWKSIDEMIKFKSSMRKPPKNNVPIDIVKVTDKKITISGRLYKSGALSYDPNIGALTLIASTLRKLGWKYDIEIVRHGLKQEHIKGKNKFLLIASQLDIKLEGLKFDFKALPTQYWHYEGKSEKLGTIFIHVTVENFTTGTSIYENHAGCERGYFITRDGVHIKVDKKIGSSNDDKDDDETEAEDIKIALPDLVLIDFESGEIINIEGKQYQNRLKGIEELGNYDEIEEHYIKKYYPEYKIIRTVVLYGSVKEEIVEVEVCFLLNKKGKIIIGTKTPHLILQSLKLLKDYWLNN